MVPIHPDFDRFQRLIRSMKNPTMHDDYPGVGDNLLHGLLHRGNLLTPGVTRWIIIKRIVITFRSNISDEHTQESLKSEGALVRSVQGQNYCSSRNLRTPNSPLECYPPYTA